MQKIYIRQLLMRSKQMLENLEYAGERQSGVYECPICKYKAGQGHDVNCSLQELINDLERMT